MQKPNSVLNESQDGLMGDERSQPPTELSQIQKQEEGDDDTGDAVRNRRRRTIMELREDRKKSIRQSRDIRASISGAGGWTAQIQKQSDKLLAESLLSIVNLIMFCSLMDVIYITLMLSVRPTACDNFIATFITTDVRGQFFIYWFSSFIHLGSLLLLLVNLTANNAFIATCAGVFNLIWHILMVVMYFATPSVGQSGQPIWRAALYWLETVITFIIIDATIVLKLRMKKDDPEDDIDSDDEEAAAKKERKKMKKRKRKKQRKKKRK